MSNSQTNAMTRDEMIEKLEAAIACDVVTDAPSAEARGHIRSVPAALRAHAVTGEADHVAPLLGQS